MTDRSNSEVADRFGLGGFTEAGICTADFEPWIQLLKGVGQWEEVWRGNTPGSTLSCWGLSSECTANEILMRSRRGESGYIRLVKIEGLDQQEIRPASKTWDSGGIFDLDIRVDQLESLVEPLEKSGWSGVSRPVDWQFGAVQVREWLAMGAESSVLAFIQRLAPPLEGWDDLRGFSHVFNSSQIVRNMDCSLEFYTRLGFQIIVNHRGPLCGQGGEVLGLAADKAPQVPVRLMILQPQGIMDGSVELVSFEDAGPEYHGEDLSDRALPSNLGLSFLRFPVRDLSAYSAFLRNQGIDLVESGIVSTTLAPFSQTDLFAVRTPDGAWLEFYQSENT